MPSSIRHLKQIFTKGTKPIVLFSKWQDDNLYYIVRLNKLDEKKGRCLIKYEDGLECWVDKQDLHLQFHTSIYPYDEAEDIFCCLCEGDESESPNEVILCDTCQQGFHQECHQPKIRQVDIENDSQEWTCQTCAYILSQLDPISKTSTPRVKSRAKRDSPRSVALKAVYSKKQASIKLTREKKGSKLSSQESSKNKKASQKSSKSKKASQESTESKKASQESINGKKSSEELKKNESIAEDSIQESEPSLVEPDPRQWTPVSEKPNPDKKVEKGDVLEPVTNNIGTGDFVQALVENAPSKVKSTNGKGAKKAVTKRSRIPAPA